MIEKKSKKKLKKRGGWSRVGGKILQKVYQMNEILIYFVSLVYIYVYIYIYVRTDVIFGDKFREMK